MESSRITRRSFLGGPVALGATVASPAVLRAQSFATRPVRMVVGNAAGGINDFMARLIAPIMAEEFGQPVVVDNRPGAAGNLGLGLAVRAAPDGHTLFASSSVMLATAHTHVSKPANPVTDLDHITMIGSGAFTFTYNANVPAQNYAEFVELAKREPGKLKHGTPGAGGNIHLAAELFKIRAGIQLTPVHYSSAGAILTDVLNNEIQLAINAIQLTAGHIRAGKLRPLFVASGEREAEVPEMPTSVELGLKDMDRITNWFGLHAPKGTPPGILRQIHAAAVKAIRAEDSGRRLAAGGFKPIGDSPEAFTARLVSDDKIFAEVAQTAAIRIE